MARHQFDVGDIVKYERTYNPKNGKPPRTLTFFLLITDAYKKAKVNTVPYKRRKPNGPYWKTKMARVYAFIEMSEDGRAHCSEIKDIDMYSTLVA